MTRPRTHSRLRYPGTPQEPDFIRALRAELAEKTARVEETILNLDNLLSPQDWLDAGDGFPGFSSWRNRPVTRQQDRSHAPINYLNEEEWRYHVALARDLVTRNHLALGFRDHVSNFIGPVQISFVLRGQTPGASASGPTDADGDGQPDVDPLVKECTQVWEEWRELAEWGQGEEDRQRECRRRAIVEGERTLRFFKGDNNSAGLPYARHLEPELIRTPSGHSTTSRYGWGVITKEWDDEREEGLWVCKADNVHAGEVLPACEYVRSKSNVDRTVKRGLSDFFPVGEHLRKILGLFDNMAHVARLQAAIAWWEQYPTATVDQVLNQIRQGADYQRSKNPPTASGASTAVTSYEAGTVVRTEGGREVKPGPVSTPEGFGKVAEIVLQGIGFRWGCPGYFSGKDAQSFAGVLVTGSPFVRITEDRQGEEKGWNCRVATRVLEFAEESARLPKGASKKVRPVATAKPVVIADEEKKARTFLSLYEKNCADPMEYIRSTGQDPKVVAANISAWKKKFPDGQGQPPAPPAPPPTGPTPAPPGSAGGDGSSPNVPDDIFGESLSDKQYALLSEAGKAGLVQKDVEVHRDGKTITQKRWVKSDQAPATAQPTAKTPPSAEQLHAAHKILAAKMPELPEDQFEALGDYTAGSYEEINKSLREGRAATKGAKAIPLIEKAIESAPVLPEPVTVYRGLRMTAEQAGTFLARVKQAQEAGEHIEEPAFMSTSINPSVATGFSSGGSGSEAPVVFEISAKKGLYLGESVGGTKEMEMVLQRGSRFKVIGIDGRTVKLEQVL